MRDKSCPPLAGFFFNIKAQKVLSTQSQGKLTCVLCKQNKVMSQTSLTALTDTYRSTKLFSACGTSNLVDALDLTLGEMNSTVQLNSVLVQIISASLPRPSSNTELAFSQYLGSALPKIVAKIVNFKATILTLLLPDIKSSTCPDASIYNGLAYNDPNCVKKPAYTNSAQFYSGDGSPSNALTCQYANISYPVVTANASCSAPNVPAMLDALAVASCEDYVVKLTLTNLDLYAVMDRSDSMNWWIQNCATVLKAGGGGYLKVRSCFDLWLYFLQQLVAQLQIDNPLLQFNENGGGLRVAMYAFWCAGHQTVPQTQVLEQLSGFESDFLNGLALGHTLIADGGTCPGQAMQMVVNMMEITLPRSLPWIANIFLSDGLVYDVRRISLFCSCKRNLRD